MLVEAGIHGLGVQADLQSRQQLSIEGICSTRWVGRNGLPSRLLP